MASLQYARPASRRLQYGYRKRREAERGPGKEASSAYCERLPEQQAGSSLLFTSVVFYKSTALLYTAKSYVLNQTWLGSDTDLFTFRYRCAVIRCNTTFWQLSDSKSKYMSDSKCNRMCNSSVD